MGASFGDRGAEKELDLRKWTWCEEDRHLFTTTPWDGGFRWFRAKNVICLEQYRRKLAKRDERR